MSTIETKLAELGLSLPPVRMPTASYVPYTVAGNIVYVAGQICQANGQVQFAGLVGQDLSIEDGYKAAQLCALNLLATAVAAAGGDSSRISRCLRLTGYVSGPSGFPDSPKVVNGASDLMLKVLGEAGKHARTAVAVAGLPSNAAVEVEGIFELK